MAIKIFRNSDVGAPALRGQAGALVAVLDAVLVQGYGEVGVTSMARVGTTVTVLTAAPHGLRADAVAAVTGADQVAYNGEFVVTPTGAQSLTFSVAGDPLTPATGASMKIRRAPAGFNKTFSKTNCATYRSRDIAGTQATLWVEDDGSGARGAREAFVRMYETMLDIDTGAGRAPVPVDASSTRGYVWVKSDVTDADSRNWTIFSDGVTVYYFVDPATTTLLDVGDGGGYVYSGGFGDLRSYRAGDAGRAFLAGNTSQGAPSPTGALYNRNTGPTSSQSFTSTYSIARDFTGGEGAVYGAVYSGAGPGACSSKALLPFPHPVDGGFYILPLLASCGGDGVSPPLIRGQLPGAYDSMHYMPTPNGAVVTNIEGLPGVRLKAQKIYSGTTPGVVYFDISSTHWG